MQIKLFPELLFLLVPWLFTHSAQAQSIVPISNVPTPIVPTIVQPEPCAAFCLTVTPTVCVTAEANQRCQQPLRIEWQGLPTTQNPCAYINNELLYCWTEQTISYSTEQPGSHGEWEGIITWPEEGTVSLTDESGTIVAEVPLSTQSLKPRRAVQHWSSSK